MTRPTKEMREVMFKAAVGDDVYGDDPSVNRLQEIAAEMLGKEAALFCSSGTQANLLALMSHCERGDEYIVGQQAHTYRFEGGGGAVLGSIQPQPLDNQPDGSLDLEQVAQAVKADDFHFARTRLLCLENTFSGKVLPLDYLKKAKETADRLQLRFHLDGARIFNAAVKLKIDVKAISTLFDSVSVCLSKTLGAPVGSVLCADRELIAKALKWRKMLGGGMRQAGIIAAAGSYALQNHIERLDEDHQNAQRLADALKEIEELQILPGSGETNMVFFQMDPRKIDALAGFLRERDILINARSPVRLVTHLDISSKEIDTAVEGFKAFFSH